MKRRHAARQRLPRNARRPGPGRGWRPVGPLLQARSRREPGAGHRDRRRLDAGVGNPGNLPARLDRLSLLQRAHTRVQLALWISLVLTAVLVAGSIAVFACIPHIVASCRVAPSAGGALVLAGSVFHAIGDQLRKYCRGLRKPRHILESRSPGRGSGRSQPVHQVQRTECLARDLIQGSPPRSAAARPPLAVRGAPG